jgi:hypothetical protein
MSTAGGVGVGLGVDVDVGGGVLVTVALGEGRGVSVVCALDTQAANNNELKRMERLVVFIMIYPWSGAIHSFVGDIIYIVRIKSGLCFDYTISEDLKFSAKTNLVGLGKELNMANKEQGKGKDKDKKKKKKQEKPKK